MKTITAIIPSFRRHENIPVIVKRLRNQTCPPARILVWNDNAGPYGKNLELQDTSIEVVNTNTNWWSNYGSFLIGYLTDTDYIAIIDDDMPPGPRWFEYCVRHQASLPGLYGRYGVIFTRNGYYGKKHLNSDFGEDIFTEVDMVGNSYFVPARAINCMLYERPPTFHHTCDLHLSYTAQKYSGLKCYVPHPCLKEELPCYRPQDLPFDKSERSMYNDLDHYVNRESYVQWAVSQGWKLLKDR